jgi:hypothetical protein
MNDEKRSALLKYKKNIKILLLSVYMKNTMFFCYGRQKIKTVFLVDLYKINHLVCEMNEKLRIII